MWWKDILTKLCLTMFCEQYAGITTLQHPAMWCELCHSQIYANTITKPSNFPVTARQFIKIGFGNLYKIRVLKIILTSVLIL